MSQWKEKRASIHLAQIAEVKKAMPDMFPDNMEERTRKHLEALFRQSMRAVERDPVNASFSLVDAFRAINAVSKDPGIQAYERQRQEFKDWLDSLKYREPSRPINLW